MSVRYEIIGCEQGTPEWHEARRGMPTASRFAEVLAEGQGKTRYKYLRQLAGEIITGEIAETYSNANMERGRREEAALRTKYCFEAAVDVVQIGFVKMNPAICKTGCSPDGLVGTDGIVEIKSTAPEALIELLDGGKRPKEHYAQVQGQLWITNRNWCDLVIGSPKMPRLLIDRIDRDEYYMASLATALRQFNAELTALANRHGEA